MKFKLSMLLIVMFVAINITAQDRHYWYQQFGGRSTLLGGAVVSDVRDNSSIYYNPAAIGFIENNMLSISANAYSLANYKIDNALGNDINIDNYPLLVYPQLISGFVPFTSNQTWKWGYSILTRNKSSYRIRVRYEDTRDILNLVDGDEKYMANYSIDSKKYEKWAGVTLGRKINKNLSFGATMFFTYKSVIGTENISYKAFPNTNQPTNNNGEKIEFEISEIGESTYYNVPMTTVLWKVGLAYDYTSWNFGLTITTTPINLGILNSGASEKEAKINNIEYKSELVQDYIEIGTQEGVKSHTKSPLSIAVGAAKQFNKVKIMFSAEYFFKINEYSMLPVSDEKTVIKTPNNFTLYHNPNIAVSEAYKSVLNFAFAADYKITENSNILASFRSDLNNTENIERDINSPIQQYNTPWNLYHFTLGGQIEGDKNKVTYGFQYTLGFGSTDQYRNFTDVDKFSVNNMFNPDLNKMNYQYNALMLIISYTHFIQY